MLDRKIELNPVSPRPDNYTLKDLDVDPKTLEDDGKGLSFSEQIQVELVGGINDVLVPVHSLITSLRSLGGSRTGTWAGSLAPEHIQKLIDLERK